MAVSGDKDMHELFVMAKWGAMLLPPKGRLSVIEVSDLARLLLTLAQDTTQSINATYEVDDGTPSGWSHADFAQAVGHAVGRNRVFAVPLPRALVQIGARVDRLIRGKNARLTPDRASYICHPDWVSRPDMAPPTALWHAQIPTPQGLAATTAAYRNKGWL